MRKKIFLFAGDAGAYWMAFAVTLLVRWGTHLSVPFVRLNAIYFAALFCIFTVVAYGMQLYQRAVYGSRKYDWLVASFVALFIFLLSSIIFLYFVARFGYQAIAPRGSLLLFWSFFALFFITWRSFTESILNKRLIERVLVIGTTPDLTGLATFLSSHQEYGFRVFSIQEAPATPEEFSTLIRNQNIETIVSSDAFFPKDLFPVLGQLSRLNIDFYDPGAFYENKIGKIYLESVSNIWVLNNVMKRTPFVLNVSKTIGEKIIACATCCVLLPVYAAISFLIMITSPGPVLYSQKRIGKNGKEFVLYKFRTMKQYAEQYGPQWAQQNDPRVTTIGRLLRASHLDELPQIINIIRGELSFVGPRPERPEFVRELDKAIPFYTLRNTILPGITGWAQINYPYGASIEDAKEKLQYDLYYLKHRSLALDLSIILKTVRRFFQNPLQTHNV